VTRLRDILGQQAAVEQIRRIHASDRMPHAMIFAGPVGVGKATVATALAALLLCEKPGDDDACGACPSCHLIAAGTHPDLHLIDRKLIRQINPDRKAIDLSIDVIRVYLNDRAGRTAVRGGAKVFIVEQAELMSDEAQNALLKTLEEPLGRTVIVLLTDQPSLLLATTRSRCQMIRFASLASEVVKNELLRRGIDVAAAAQAADLSGGSLGRALAWIEQGVVAAAGELKTRLEAVAAGRGASDLDNWLRKAADAYSKQQEAREGKWIVTQATRDGLNLYLGLAADHFARLLREPAGSPEAQDRACTAIEAIAQAEQNLDANVAVALVFQQLAVALERCFGR
jgi:DNA polymerase-3 subunit delta'